MVRSSPRQSKSKSQHAFTHSKLLTSHSDPATPFSRSNLGQHIENAHINALTAATTVPRPTGCEPPSRYSIRERSSMQAARDSAPHDGTSTAINDMTHQGNVGCFRVTHEIEGRMVLQERIELSTSPLPRICSGASLVILSSLFFMTLPRYHTIPQSRSNLAFGWVRRTTDHSAKAELIRGGSLHLLWL
jgi:hypothetical protein